VDRLCSDIISTLFISRILIELDHSVITPTNDHSMHSNRRKLMSPLHAAVYIPYLGGLTRRFKTQ